MTADEMYTATHERINAVDVFIAAAAVSDYRPAEARAQKIKKSEETMHIELVRSKDILASVAALDDGPFTVGFAAETGSLARAPEKAARKGVDLATMEKWLGPNLAYEPGA